MLLGMLIETMKRRLGELRERRRLKKMRNIVWPRNAKSHSCIRVILIKCMEYAHEAFRDAGAGPSGKDIEPSG